MDYSAKLRELLSGVSIGNQPVVKAKKEDSKKKKNETLFEPAAPQSGDTSMDDIYDGVVSVNSSSSSNNAAKLSKTVKPSYSAALSDLLSNATINGKKIVTKKPSGQQSSSSETKPNVEPTVAPTAAPTAAPTVAPTTTPTVAPPEGGDDDVTDDTVVDPPVVIDPSKGTVENLSGLLEMDANSIVPTKYDEYGRVIEFTDNLIHVGGGTPLYTVSYNDYQENISINSEIENVEIGKQVDNKTFDKDGKLIGSVSTSYYPNNNIKSSRVISSYGQYEGITTYVYDKNWNLTLVKTTNKEKGFVRDFTYEKHEYNDANLETKYDYYVTDTADNILRRDYIEREYYDNGKLKRQDYSYLYEDGSTSVGESLYTEDGNLSETLNIKADADGVQTEKTTRKFENDRLVLTTGEILVKPGSAEWIYANSKNFKINNNNDEPVTISYTIDENGKMEINASGIEIFPVEMLWNNTLSGSIGIPTYNFGEPLTDVVFRGDNNKIFGTTLDDNITVFGNNNVVDLGSGNDTLNIAGLNNRVLNVEDSTTTGTPVVDPDTSVVIDGSGRVSLKANETKIVEIKTDKGTQKYSIQSSDEAQIVDISFNKDTGIVSIAGENMQITDLEGHDDKLSIVGKTVIFNAGKGCDNVVIHADNIKLTTEEAANDKELDIFILEAKGDLMVEAKDGKGDYKISANKAYIQTGDGDQTINADIKEDVVITTGKKGWDDIKADVGGYAQIVTNAGSDFVELNVGGNFNIDTAASLADLGKLADNDKVIVKGDSKTGTNSVTLGFGSNTAQIYADNTEILQAQGSLDLEAIGDKLNVRTYADRNNINFYGDDVTLAMDVNESAVNNVRTLDMAALTGKFRVLDKDGNIMVSSLNEIPSNERTPRADGCYYSADGKKYVIHPDLKLANAFQNALNDGTCKISDGKGNIYVTSMDNIPESDRTQKEDGYCYTADGERYIIYSDLANDNFFNNGIDKVKFAGVTEMGSDLLEQRLGKKELSKTVTTENLGEGVTKITTKTVEQVNVGGVKNLEIRTTADSANTIDVTLADVTKLNKLGIINENDTVDVNNPYSITNTTVDEVYNYEDGAKGSVSYIASLNPEWGINPENFEADYDDDGRVISLTPLPGTSTNGQSYAITYDDVANEVKVSPYNAEVGSASHSYIYDAAKKLVGEEFLTPSLGPAGWTDVIRYNNDGSETIARTYKDSSYHSGLKKETTTVYEDGSKTIKEEYEDKTVYTGVSKDGDQNYSVEYDNLPGGAQITLYQPAPIITNITPQSCKLRPVFADNSPVTDDMCLTISNGDEVVIEGSGTLCNGVTVTKADGTVVNYSAQLREIAVLRLYEEVTFSDGSKYNIAGWNDLSDAAKAKVEKIFKTPNNRIAANNIYYASIKENSDGSITVDNGVAGQVMYNNGAWISNRVTFKFDSTGNVKSFSVEEYQIGTEKTRVRNFDKDGVEITLVDGTLFEEVTLSDGSKYNISGWNDLSDAAKAKVEKIFKTPNNGVSASGVFYATIKENSDGSITVGNGVAGQVTYINGAWIPNRATFTFDNAGNVKGFYVEEYQIGTEKTRVRNFDKDGVEITLVDGTLFEEVTFSDGSKYNISGWNDLSDAAKAKVEKIFKTPNNKIAANNIYYASIKENSDGSITVGNGVAGQVTYINGAWIPNRATFTFDNAGNVKGFYVEEYQNGTEKTRVSAFDKDGNKIAEINAGEKGSVEWAQNLIIFPGSNSFGELRNVRYDAMGRVISAKAGQSSDTQSETDVRISYNGDEYTVTSSRDYTNVPDLVKWVGETTYNADGTVEQATTKSYKNEDLTEYNATLSVIFNAETGVAENPFISKDYKNNAFVSGNIVFKTKMVSIEASDEVIINADGSVQVNKANGKFVKYNSVGEITDQTPVIEAGEVGSVKFFEDANLSGADSTLKIVESSVKYDEQGRVISFEYEGNRTLKKWDISYVENARGRKVTAYSIYIDPNNQNRTYSERYEFNGYTGTKNHGYIDNRLSEDGTRSHISIDFVGSSKTVYTTEYDSNDNRVKFTETGIGSTGIIGWEKVNTDFDGTSYGKTVSCGYNADHEVQYIVEDYLRGDDYPRVSVWSSTSARIGYGNNKFININTNDSAVIDAEGKLTISRADNTIEIYDRQGNPISTV